MSPKSENAPAKQFPKYEKQIIKKTMVIVCFNVHVAEVSCEISQVFQFV